MKTATTLLLVAMLAGCASEPPQQSQAQSQAQTVNVNLVLEQPAPQIQVARVLSVTKICYDGYYC
jgi:type IV pilus biogenesis protein CpaD/CtpE